jgi:hypothetical protein
MSASIQIMPNPLTILTAMFSFSITPLAKWRPEEEGGRGVG